MHVQGPRAQPNISIISSSAYTLAFADTFLFSSTVAALALVVTLTLRRPNPSRNGRAPYT
jgi:hypothetical protein